MIDWIKIRAAHRSGRVLAAAVICASALAIVGCGSAKTTSTDGKQIFSDAGCGGCHTLASAGADGNSGPNLDELKPTSGEVDKQVTVGGGGMPAFEGDLTPAQITAVSEFVASTAGN